MPGTLRPDELLERTGIFVPEDGPYETLGGFMMLKLGRIGEPHDKVQVENTTLEILRMDGRRIDQILVRAAEPEPTDEGREDTK